ncbi:MAG: DUF790 family protein [Planctomycetes bacterium]|nr:DUF790 family protein [Planctomycetota bacterium]
MASIPRAAIRVREADGRVVPPFLVECDWPWLAALIDKYRRFVGRRRRELDARLREPLPRVAPPGKLRLAKHVLDRLWSDGCASPIRPRIVRARVFSRAAEGGTPDVVLAEVARSLRTSATELRDALFADLPGERRLGSEPPGVSAAQLALHTNLALVQSLLGAASNIRVEIDGNARDVVRYAKLRGLICTVEPAGGDSAVRLEISGPLALFRRTILYANALAGLVPRLAWCRQFRLEADVVVARGAAILVIQSGDPIFPSMPPRPFDSRVEERFARDFSRAALQWTLVREPCPIEVDGTLLFPDFALEHRSDEARRWFLEIVGFWTPEYLARKLAQIRRARLGSLIVCIDDERNCGESDFPAEARVVRYRRRIDPAAVLAIVDADATK